ncbi:MAG: DUF2007 domain-containing protein [Oculatellaceae cyanobacterium Prado106]|nr:DUF2007 domain-containing protein [Oculatellaceae cyanobacterium Prado106]
MTWTTIRTTDHHWEAELMQQMLTAQGIPARVIAQGSTSYPSCGLSAVLQVRPQDQWTALLLLSPMEDEVQEA